MTTILRPKVSLSILPAALEISVAPQRILFIGQKTSAGTATSGALVENIPNDNSENTLFGENSMLAGMIRSAKLINKVTQMDAIGLSDAGGAVAATGTVAFSGTATEDGTLYITVGSTYSYRYEIAVESGDTATVIGGKLETAINADTKVPVTATNTTGSVELEAVNAGLEGNAIGLRYEGSVGGITITLTAFASGATNPTITSIFNAIGDKRYQTIVWPSTYTLSVLTNFLGERFNVTNEVLDGVGITTITDTYANLLTAGNAQNSQSLVMFGNRKLTDTDLKGPSMLELNNIVSSQFAALRALRFTDGASISRYVNATRGALDAFGGPALASLPYFNSPFYNLPIIPTAKGFTKEEVDDLADAGISVFGNNVTRTQIILSDVLTTYKTDSAGNPDISFKYLNYVDTISNIREYMVNNLRARFSQCRLTEGDLVAGRNIANEDLIRAVITQYYINLSDQDYVLTQSGEVALDFFKENLVVSLELSTGTVTINMVTPIVTQLREIVGTIQIAFSTQALQ
jgi:phage tail sheath gpL-like